MTKQKYFWILGIIALLVIIGIIFVIIYNQQTQKSKIPVEKYCEQDADCACGAYINTGDCFYGNNNYVNTLQQCPDFCTGFAGNLRIKCVNNECKQVSTF